MLISQKDVGRLKNIISDVLKEQMPENIAASALWAFCVENPHLFMMDHFDEHMQIPIMDEHAELVMNQMVMLSSEIPFVTLKLPRLEYRTPSGRWAGLIDLPYLEDPYGNFSEGFLFSFNLRQALQEFSKVDLEEGIDWDLILNELGHSLSEDAIGFPVEELIAALESRIVQPREKTAILWTPKLWTPQEQARQKFLLDTSLAPHFQNWKRSGICFEDLNPSEFEDLVGEVLLSAGLKIHKVREVPQGGRDLIARGSLIPGEEPIEMAVEVKHRRSVDRPEVQLALYQNRAYPALLFVTSGRFSAGVFQEKAREENRFRLFLKDGFAIGDLVREHFRLQQSARQIGAK